jgi:hypothetical protein
VRGKSFQVGRYARSAGRVKPSYRQQNWWSVVRVIVQFLGFLADIAQTNMPALPLSRERTG